MKRYTLVVLLAAVSCFALAQGPLDVNNGNNTVVLIPVSGAEPIWVMHVPKGDGFEAVPKERFEQALKDGYRPVLSGELAQLLRAVFTQHDQLTKELNSLASDYELLVGKYNRLAALQSAPTYVPAAPPPTPARPDKSDLLMKYLMLRSLMPQPQPYQLPMPVAPRNNNINCTTRAIGNTAYTDCH